MKKNLHIKWLIGSVGLLLASIVLIILSLTVLNDFVTVDKSLNSTTEAYLSFNTNYAEVGSPLTVSVHNLDKSEDEIVYTWTIGSQIINNHSDTYIPTENDLEKFITVEVSYDFDKSISASLYCSKLPVIYINTADGLSVGDEYTTASIAMQGSPEYTNENTDFYFGGAQIKLRGNSTKNRLKKPYKLKLDTACDLYGMGLNKHWVLLANDIDHTHIRNHLVFELSKNLGMPYTTDSTHVILIFNNEYQGVYQLCEQIRIDSERVDVFSWEALADDAAELIAQVKQQTEGLNNETTKNIEDELSEMLKTNLSWLSAPYEFEYQNVTYKITDYVDIPDTTGGFLLEMDFYHLYDPAISQITTNHMQPFFFSSPEYAVTNKNLYEYAKNYIQTFEYALHSDDFFYHDEDIHYESSPKYFDWNTGWQGIEFPVKYSDPERDGYHYSQLFSLDSLINNFIICEFTMNWDSMKNSVFITKDISGLASLSPAWDYDWAFGNINMYQINTWFPESWHTTNEYFTNEQYYQSVQWNRYLIKDPYFLLKAYEKYKQIRPTIIEDIIKEDGTIDKYYQYLKEAGNANDDMWKTTYISYNSVSFDKSMTKLRDFIETRVAWLDKQFADFDTFVTSLGYYTPSEEITIDSIQFNTDGTATITASTTNAQTKKIALQVNGTSVYEGDVVDGSTTITTRAVYSNGAGIVVASGLNKNGDYIDGITSYKVYGGE